VFSELQQRFSDSMDVSAACVQMLAAGVTDASIIRSSNAHDFVSKFLPDGVTVHFIEIFKQCAYRQKTVCARECNTLAFEIDAVVPIADLIIVAGSSSSP
jgi:hypothetical protein